MKRLPVLLALLLPGLAFGACARPQAPPGGDPDRLSPALVTTSPEPLTVISDLNTTAVFRFNERLRHRSFNRTFVSVMPGEPEDHEVELAGNEIRVRRTGGWLPGQVYLIVVRPGLEDLFGNKRRDPVELVFSTGPEVPPTALAGLVTDRLTGEGARDALVEAVRRPDSTTYRTAVDSAAFFALRHAPYGAYDLRAFSDRNRNARLDPGESRSDPVLVNLAPGADTITLAFTLLPGDTTGPRLTRAESMDSLHLRLGFDDYIDLDAGLVQAGYTIYQLPDSTLVAEGRELQLASMFEAERQRTAPPADTTRRAPGDTARRAAADTARAPTDLRRPGPPGRPGVQANRTPRPDRTVIVTLSRPLPPGNYVIVVEQARNVNLLVGGGSARFPVRAPARPPGETTAPRPDTTGVRPDTSGLRR